MSSIEEDLPDGWATATLGDVTIPKVAQVNDEGPLTYVDIGSVDNSSKRVTEPKSLAKGDKIPSRARQHLVTNDVIVSMTRPNLNAVALIPDELNDSIGSTGFDVLRCIEMEPTWLFNIVRSKQFVDSMSAIVQGALYPAVRPGDIRKYEIPVPPLAEQRRIVAKIEALQERNRKAREALSEVKPLLEKFRQSLLAAAFRGDLTADWRKQNPDVEPASELLQRIRKERRQKWEQAELAKYEAKGKKPPKGWKDKYKEPAVTFKSDVASIEFGIPEDTAWEVAPLELLVDPERSIPYGIVKTGDPYPDGVPTVRGGDIKRFTIALERLKQVNPAVHEQYQRTWLRGGEVLIAIRGTVGETVVVSDEMKGMNISREVALIPVLPNVESRFLMYLLASPAAQRLITGQVKGVAQSGINLSDLRLLPTPLPSLEEQIEIANRIEQALLSIDELSRGVEESHASLSQLDQSILAKAFRGKLVPQDPEDEPAAVLLERIRQQREAATAAGKKRKKARAKGAAR